jgi:hypothetical protein
VHGCVSLINLWCYFRTSGGIRVKSLGSLMSTETRPRPQQFNPWYAIVPPESVPVAVPTTSVVQRTDVEAAVTLPHQPQPPSTEPVPVPEAPRRPPPPPLRRIEDPPQPVVRPAFVGPPRISALQTARRTISPQLMAGGALPRPRHPGMNVRLPGPSTFQPRQGLSQVSSQCFPVLSQFIFFFKYPRLPS